MTVLAFASLAVTVVSMLWVRRLAVPLLACAVLAVLPPPQFSATALASGSGSVVVDNNTGPVNTVTGGTQDGSSLVSCDPKTGQGIYNPTGKPLYDENWCDGVTGDWKECLTGYDVWRFYGSKGNPVKFATMSQASLRDWCLDGKAAQVNLFFPNPWDERASWPRSLPGGGGKAPSNNDGSGSWQSPWSISSAAEPTGRLTYRGDRVVGSFTNGANKCLRKTTGGIGDVFGPRGYVADVLHPDCIPTTGQILAVYPTRGSVDCQDALPPKETRLSSAIDPRAPLSGRAGSTDAQIDGNATVADQARSLLRETYFAVRDLVASGFRGKSSKADPVATLGEVEKFTLGWLGYDLDMTSARPFTSPDDAPGGKSVSVLGGKGSITLMEDSCASPINYMKFPLVDARGAVVKAWSAQDLDNPLLGMCVAPRLRPMWKTVRDSYTGWVVLTPEQAKASGWPASVQDLVGDRYSKNKVNVPPSAFINSAIKLRTGGLNARAAQDNTVKEINRIRGAKEFYAYMDAIRATLSSKYVKGGMYSGPGGYWFPKKKDVPDVTLTPFVVEQEARESMSLESAMETLSGQNAKGERVGTPGARCFTTSPTPGQLNSEGLEVTKTASRSTFSAAGQSISYTITATNRGSMRLSGVEVVDPKVTLRCSPSLPASLAPGARVTCTGTYTTSQADVSATRVTNTATASGNTSTGSRVSGSDTEVVTLEGSPPPTPTPTPTPTSPPPPTGTPLNGGSGDVTVYVQMDSAFSAQGGYSPRSVRVTGVSQPVCRASDPRICPTLVWVRGGLRLSHQNFAAGSGSYRRCASPSGRACDYYVYNPATRSAVLAPPSSNVLGQQVSGLFFSPTPPGVQVVASFEGLNALIQTYYLEPTYTTYGPFECGTEEEPRSCSFTVLDPQSMWIVRNGPQVPLGAGQIGVVPSGSSGTLTRRVFGSVG